MKLIKLVSVIALILLGNLGFAQEYTPSPVTSVERAVLDSLNVDQFVNVNGYIVCDSLDSRVGTSHSTVVIDIYATKKVSADTVDSYNNSEITFIEDVAVDSIFSVGTDVLYVDPVTGNVGIGTTSPSEKLHIAGNGKLRIDGGSRYTNIWYQPDKNLHIDTSVGGIELCT
ncbi:MAG: hypothetical protein DRN21_05570, partial [Thermoplasmata archaeon]